VTTRTLVLARVLCIGVLVPGLVLAAPPAPQKSGGFPTYIPAGISDEAGSVGCLYTPAGGVEAVDLATGRSLWRSDAPARALLLAGGQAFLLEERAGRLRVASYGARRGRVARSYDLTRLVLPAWASPAEPRAGRQWTEFGVAARLDGDTLELHYDATRHQAYGFQRPGVVDQVQGVVRVALDSGRIALRVGSGEPPPPISGPAPPVPGARLVSVHARRADATIVLGGPPANVDGALLDGSRRSVFELSPDSRTVIVHRFDERGRRRLSPVRLEHGHATDAVWATLDRRHVLLRRADDQRSYDLYSLETGASLVTLESPVDVAVVGRSICWTARAGDGGLELRTTDVASGRIVWRRTVREAEGDPGPPIP